MRLTARLLALVGAATLLVVALPFMLVQLDLIPASLLSVVPAVLAVVLAVALVSSIALSRRRPDQ